MRRTSLRTVSATVTGLLLVLVMTHLRPSPGVPPAQTQVVGRAGRAAEAPPWPDAPRAPRRQFYASPTGSSKNPGSIGRPLDLVSGLSAQGPLKPGDVLWLRKGTYRGNFRSDLTGAPGAMIVVAQYPGERAVLDGAPSPMDPVLRVDGAYVVFWGFEVTSSATEESNVQRGAGIDIFGPYTKFINLVIHHTGNGIGLWTPALAAELYGCVIYRSGWDATDRGHGHSVYVQNDAPDKRLVDNILFDGRSFGIHGYTEGGQIDNLHIEGNIAFDHGVLSRVSGAKANILVGGRHVAHRPVLLSNYTYQRGDRDASSVEVGHIAGCSDAVIRNNYFAGREPILLSRCDGVVMTGNTFAGKVASAVKSGFPDNRYVEGRPAQSEIFVRPNKYQAGRGNIAIYNWERRASVQVDLSKVGLRAGDRYEIRDVRNYFGTALITGIYRNSTVDLPLTHMVSADPAGSSDGSGVAPEFGAAVVLPLATRRAHGLPWAAPEGDQP